MAIGGIRKDACGPGDVDDVFILCAVGVHLNNLSFTLMGHVEIAPYRRQAYSIRSAIVPTNARRRCALTIYVSRKESHVPRVIRNENSSATWECDPQWANITLA